MNRPALPHGGIFDPGLQPERTTLAWRRTALSLVVGALVSMRLLPPVLGLWSLAPGIGGLALAAAIWVLAGRRGREVQQTLVHRGGPMPDGSLLAIVGVTTLLGAAVGLLYVLTR